MSSSLNLFNSIMEKRDENVPKPDGNMGLGPGENSRALIWTNV